MNWTELNTASITSTYSYTVCVLSARKLALCFFGAAQLKLLNAKRGSCTIIEHVSRHALTPMVAVGIKKEKELETWL